MFLNLGLRGVEVLVWRLGGQVYRDSWESCNSIMQVPVNANRCHTW